MLKTSNIEHIPGKLSKAGKKRKKDCYEEVGCDDVDSPSKAFYMRARLFDIPSWKYNAYRHYVDVMHVEKNFTEHLIDTILDIKGKSKDSVRAREDMKKMNIHSGKWITTDSETGKDIVPVAGFCLSKEERNDF